MNTLTTHQPRNDLKAEIVRLGLTFREVARKCGVSNVHLSAVLNGRERLTLRLARDISRETGISLAVVLGEKTARASAAPNGEPADDDLDAALTMAGATLLSEADLPDGEFEPLESAPDGTPDPETVPACAFCGTPEGEYAVRTGVSMYPACIGCSNVWEASDKTIEALRALRERGGRA